MCGGRRGEVCRRPSIISGSDIETFCFAYTDSDSLEVVVLFYLREDKRLTIGWVRRKQPRPSQTRSGVEVDLAVCLRS